MRLTKQQIDQYREHGFLVVESLFSQSEVDDLVGALHRDAADPGPHRVLEDDGRLRAIYASHQRSAEFADLVRSPRLLGPVRQLLTDDVYVYQFKINAKPAFGGGKWAWHQDYIAWKIADNLPSPALVNVGFFIDDVTEFNGPLIFVPGSHRYGQFREDRADQATSEQHLDPDDIALKPAQMTALVHEHGMASPKARAGSVVFFHPEIVHGSAPNMSPFPRRLLIATYNDVANEPRPFGEPRPEYVVGRDTTPLRPVDATLEQVSA